MVKDKDIFLFKEELNCTTHACQKYTALQLLHLGKDDSGLTAASSIENN